MVSPPGMPSGAVMTAYLLTCFVLFSLAMASLAPLGLVSRQCVDGQPCSAAELILLSLL